MPDEPPSNGMSESGGPNIPMGFLLVGSEMVTFTLFGLLLDYLIGSMPGCTIAFTLLGVAFAFFHLTKMAKVFAKKTGKPEPPTEGGPGGGGEKS